MSLRVHDTLKGEKRTFEPLEPGKVRMYVCGVTPYDRSHLGHARVYVAFDVVYRYLQHLGFEVTYVRNFTDVDDKIIARAHEREISPLVLAQQNIELYHRDMDLLGNARPNAEPRVSTSIPQIVDLIGRLIERGMAYAAEGDVYFAVERFEGYGKLGKRTLDDMLAGARVEVSAKKRHPMDFALWKGAKPGEPAWDSPWGSGRPGWHIECSAMSMDVLGETLDIHGGGADLTFPHHENEIAQSEGATGHPYVNFWMHNGFVNRDGEKMSKSLGNFFTISEILERYEPKVVRFFLLGTHYRNPINFSDAGLDEAAARLAYFYETLRKTEAFLDQTATEIHGPHPGQTFVEEMPARFREALDDDFNTARALAHVAEAFKLLNELIVMKKARQLPGALLMARQLRDHLRDHDTVLHLFDEDPSTYLERHRTKAALRREVDVEWIAARVGDRLVARSERDWAGADAIRDELLAAGIVLMDGAAGTDWMIQDVRPGAAPLENP